jgi:hypothetical protein
LREVVAYGGIGYHIGAMSEPSSPNEKAERPAAPEPPKPPSPPEPREIGGPKGPEPTRHGDWEYNGRCTDF